MRKLLTGLATAFCLSTTLAVAEEFSAKVVSKYVEFTGDVLEGALSIPLELDSGELGMIVLVCYPSRIPMVAISIQPWNPSEQSDVYLYIEEVALLSGDIVVSSGAPVFRGSYIPMNVAIHEFIGDIFRGNDVRIYLGADDFLQVVGQRTTNRTIRARFARAYEYCEKNNGEKTK